MSRGPRALSDEIISNFALDAAPAPLEATITRLTVELGWFVSEDVAAELTSGWVHRIKTELHRLLEAGARMGRPSTYSFNSVSEYMIQGSAFIESSDPPPVAEAKRRRSLSGRYADHLKGIDPSAFEAVCRGILGVLGCHDPQLTSYSKDEGIDFFGRLSLEGRLGNSHALGSVDRTLQIWLVGQAKHYSATTVSTPDLRELAGSVELAKTSTYAGSGNGFEGLTIAALDPVVYLFITTGTISSASWRLIERSGMIAMDGQMVAAFLAENGVGMSDSTFDAEALDSWILENSQR